ncbi:hypothetical protein HLB25_01445 [Dickeya dadantii]|uniref:hypothetical protein n=1 Tax=Dickeya dadantii TaxID=204038 RepID=UPI001495EA7E|nr:hypothetical protein [Dickeya dadantii]NPE57546.1 hypothetical protein [Dickeya dadantii]NPE65544.1 hypothetical protein [Dickeya dadantii]
MIYSNGSRCNKSDLLLINYLILNDFIKKQRLASNQAQPAPALGWRVFSNPNTHSYPQKWWITPTSARASCIGVFHRLYLPRQRKALLNKISVFDPAIIIKKSAK